MSEPPAGPDRPVADRLQALLDRAASEDDTAVGKRLDAVLGELVALRESLEAGEGHQRLVDEVSTLAAQVRSDDADAQTSLTALIGTVQTVAEETPAVRESVVAVHEEVGRLRERLDVVDALADRLRALHEHVDEVPRDVAALRRDVDAMDVAAVGERVDTLGSDLDASLDRIRAAVSETGSRDVLDAVLQRLEGLEDTVIRTAGVVVALEDAGSAAPLEALRSTLEQMDATVQDLPMRLDGLREPDALPWLTTALEEGSEQRAAAAAEAIQVRERLEDLDAQVGELAETLRSRVEPDPEQAAESVAERVRELVAEEVEQALATRMPSLLEGVERRVGAHVDDAVMVLAEALLRRRVPAALAAAEESETSAQEAQGPRAPSSRAGSQAVAPPAVSSGQEEQAASHQEDDLADEQVADGSSEGPGGEAADDADGDGDRASGRRARRSWRRNG